MEQGFSGERVRPGLCFPQRGSQHELLVAVQRGDKAAFQQLVTAYDETVLRFALNITGSEKAAQEIFCHVFRDLFLLLSRRGLEESLFVLVYRILAHRCIDFCRGQKMPRGSPEPSTSSGRLNQVQPRVNQVATGSGPAVAPVFVTRNALESLPPKQRIVFQLKQFQGLKVQTLAEIFHVSPAKISETLQAAIANLRTCSKAAA